LGNGTEEFPEIIQGWRKHHLIVQAGRNLEHWDSDDVTDDLRINSDEMACNWGLTSTAVEISPVVRLDDVKYVVQRWHHDISPKDIPLSNDGAVHNFGLNCNPIFHKPLTDPARWTTSRHVSAKDPTRIFQKNIPKIFLLG
jgi:hypothetical protein